MAYGKIHDRILVSSLMLEALPTRWVFVAMLAECNRHGIVRGHPEILAQRYGVTRQQFDEAIAVLTSPDESSRTRDHEGRRLLPLEEERHAWVIVNHQLYRDMRDMDEDREKERTRKQDYRNRKREEEAQNATPEGMSQDVPDCPTMSQQAEAEAKAEAEAEAESIRASDTVDLVVAQYNEVAAAVGLPLVRKVTDKRRKAVMARVSEAGVDDVCRAISEIDRSTFLQGTSGRDSWPGATFDWIMAPSNFVKVLEGNYRDKQTKLRNNWGKHEDAPEIGWDD